jgi:hypothetical protein
MPRRKPREWRKDFPYYKVQTFNTVWNSWTDEPRAYGSLEEAGEVIQRKLSDRRTRIIIVEREGRRVYQG